MDDTTTEDSTSSGSDDSWTREAFRNPILAAAEIYFIACPSERVPWRDLLRMSRGPGGASPQELFAHPPHPPEAWGRRGGRRRRGGCGPSWKPEAAALRVEEEVVAKEPPRMDSPTTPLSWNVAAASSASGSGGGGCEASREDDAVTTDAVTTAVVGTKRRRSDAHGNAAAAPVLVLAAATVPSSTAAAPVLVLAAATVPSSTAAAADRSVLVSILSSINQVHTEAAGTTTTAGGAQPTGPPPPPAAGTSCASISRTTWQLLGKKMTLTELKCYEQSLLHENTELRKELEMQRKARDMLLEENRRLQMLKEKHHSQAVRQPLLPSNVKQAADSEKCQIVLFDLNVPATEEQIDAAEGFQCR